jgi:hypothetical protein
LELFFWDDQLIVPYFKRSVQNTPRIFIAELIDKIGMHSMVIEDMAGNYVGLRLGNEKRAQRQLQLSCRL